MTARLYPSGLHFEHLNILTQKSIRKLDIVTNLQNFGRYLPMLAFLNDHIFNIYNCIAHLKSHSNRQG